MPVFPLTSLYRHFAEYNPRCPRRYRQLSSYPIYTATGTSPASHCHDPYCSNLTFSCVKTIRETLSALSPPPTSIHASVVSQSVTIQHSPSLSESDLRSALDEAGFDIVLPASSATPGSPSAAEHNIYQLRRSSNLIPEWLSRKRAKHAAQCLLCRNEQTALRPESTTETLAGLPHSTSSKALSIAETLVNHNSPSDPRTSALGSHGFNKNALEDIVDEVDSVQGPFIAIFSIDGMTCSSCVGNVTRAAAELPGVTNISVNLINNSAAATVERRDVVDTIKSAIEDGGYGCELMSVERIVPVKPKASVANKATKKARTMDEGPYHVVFSVDGMTCASCVSNVTRALETIKGVTEIGVDLVGKSAAATVDRRELADIVKEAIEDCGYGVEVISNEAIEYDDDDNKLGGPRTVNLKVEGMFCQCVVSVYLLFFVTDSISQTLSGKACRRPQGFRATCNCKRAPSFAYLITSHPQTDLHSITVILHPPYYPTRSLCCIIPTLPNLHRTPALTRITRSRNPHPRAALRLTSPPLQCCRCYPNLPHWHRVHDTAPRRRGATDVGHGADLGWERVKGAMGAVIAGDAGNVL